MLLPFFLPFSHGNIIYCKFHSCQPHSFIHEHISLQTSFSLILLWNVFFFILFYFNFFYFLFFLITTQYWKIIAIHTRSEIYYILSICIFRAVYILNVYKFSFRRMTVVYLQHCINFLYCFAYKRKRKIVIIYNIIYVYIYIW